MIHHNKSLDRKINVIFCTVFLTTPFEVVRSSFKAFVLFWRHLVYKNINKHYSTVPLTSTPPCLQHNSESAYWFNFIDVI